MSKTAAEEKPVQMSFCEAVDIMQALSDANMYILDELCADTRDPKLTQEQIDTLTRTLVRIRNAAELLSVRAERKVMPGDD